jgi:hypothetical protein
MGYGARGVAASLRGRRAAEGRKNFAEFAILTCKLLQTTCDYAVVGVWNAVFANLQSHWCKLASADSL